MGNLQGFDATQVEPQEEMDVLPAGKYAALISGSEMKPTKAGTGSYLELTFQIIEGKHQNRLLWSRLNLNNPNSTAVEIARRELSAICRAVGVLVPTDSSELHNKPLEITVKVKNRSDTGEPTNEIGGYKKREKPGSQFEPSTPAPSGSASAWAQTMD